MPATFAGGGLKFLYPENWTVERSDGEDGWSVAIQSPGTAFMLVSVHPSRPLVEDVLNTTLAALREDYPELEAEAASERIAKHRAEGYDVRFFSLDLVNTCQIRSFRTPKNAVLIMSQADDLELEVAEPVMHAIRASMEFVDQDRQ